MGSAKFVPLVRDWQAWQRQTVRFFSLKRNLRLVFLLSIGLAIALMGQFSLAANAQVAAAASQPAELRGVWLTNVDSDVLFSKDNLREAIRRLARLNFNTIYPTVWNGGYTLYPSDVTKESFGQELYPEPGLQDRDILKESVSLAHERGLAVIPWLESGLMAPSDSELVQRHPDWVTQRRDGSKIFNVHGHDHSVWLNPAHPGVQQFLTKLVTEIVDKYDVDGIQFDDHLGIPVEVGYDNYTVRLYQLENGGRQPPANPSDPAWMRWRANKLSDLMVRISAAVRAKKSDCLISLAPNPKDFAYQRYLQDWYTWQRMNYIDELIVQVYRTDNRYFIGEIDRPELQALRNQMPVGIGILTGLTNRSVNTRDIEDQVRLTRDRRFAGVAFFFYESLGRRDAVFQALFPRPAERPHIGSYRNG